MAEDIEQLSSQNRSSLPWGELEGAHLFFWGGGGSATLCAFPPPRPSIFSDYYFWSPALLTGMTVISLHMQWPLTSQEEHTLPCRFYHRRLHKRWAFHASHVLIFFQFFFGSADKMPDRFGPNTISQLGNIKLRMYPCMYVGKMQSILINTFLDGGKVVQFICSHIVYFNNIGKKLQGIIGNNQYLLHHWKCESRKI
jgi:hypothetical protein